MGCSFGLLTAIVVGKSGGSWSKNGFRRTKLGSTIVSWEVMEWEVQVVSWKITSLETMRYRSASCKVCILYSWVDIQQTHMGWLGP